MSPTVRDAPFFSVKLVPEGGRPQSLDLGQRVLSFVYDDEEKRADKLTLTIDNRDLSNFDDPTWRHGDKLEITWGYPGNTAPPRQCVIRHVTGGTILNVEAIAVSVLMDRVTKLRVFENLKRSDVVRKIAEENGFGSTLQHVEDTEIVLPHITQARLTDAQFVKKLALREGFEFFVDATGFHFHRRDLAQKPARTLTYYIDQGQGDIVHFEVETDITGRPGAVKLRGIDPLGKKKLAESATNDSVERDGLGAVSIVVDPKTGEKTRQVGASSEEIRHTTESNPSSVKRQAAGRFLQAQSLTAKLTLTIIGDPQITAKRIVEIAGLGRRLSGRYYITSARHAIDANGYTIDLRCHRDGHGGYGDARSVASKATQNTKSPPDGPTVEQRKVVDPRSGETRYEWTATGQER